MVKNREKVSVSAKRWATYAIAGAAAAVGTNVAEADITHITVGSPAGDITLGGGGFTFSLSGTANLQVYQGAVGTAGTAGVALARIVNSAATLYAGSMAGFTAGGFGYASNFQTSGGAANGALINSLGNFAPGNRTLAYAGGFGNDQFLDTGGYIAFSFNGGTQFGWARFTNVIGAPANTYVLEEYAFTDTPGEQISVGQTASIPEPGSLAALALGAVGLAAFRRRKSVA